MKIGRCCCWCLPHIYIYTYTLTKVCVRRRVYKRLEWIESAREPRVYIEGDARPEADIYEKKSGGWWLWYGARHERVEGENGSRPRASASPRTRSIAKGISPTYGSHRFSLSRSHRNKAPRAISTRTHIGPFIYIYTSSLSLALGIARWRWSSAATAAALSCGLKARFFLSFDVPCLPPPPLILSPLFLLRMYIYITVQISLLDDAVCTRALVQLMPGGDDPDPIFVDIYIYIYNLSRSVSHFVLELEFSFVSIKIIHLFRYFIS